jgi:hypothetical protein
MDLSLKVEMAMRTLKKYWPHLLLWTAMIVYFIFAPNWFTRVFIKSGKPVQVENLLTSPSKRISFVVDGLDPYIEDGQTLYNLYGWGYIAPEAGKTVQGFVPEIALVSDNNIYFFAVKTGYRNPGPQSMFADAGVNLDALGFNALIAEDSIKPGKYRIALVFKDSSTGEAYYWDKPAHYLIKTPNTLTLK